MNPCFLVLVYSMNLRGRVLYPPNKIKMEIFKEKFIALIIEKCGVEKEQVTPEAKFMDDLGADSLDMVEMVMEFEKEFKIQIPDEVAEEIKTVADAEKYILNTLAKKESN